MEHNHAMFSIYLSYHEANSYILLNGTSNEINIEKQDKQVNCSMTTNLL